jgi:hypothetical protein
MPLRFGQSGLSYFYSFVGQIDSQALVITSLTSAVADAARIRSILRSSAKVLTRWVRSACTIWFFVSQDKQETLGNRLWAKLGITYLTY